jgi:hypothetical protein
MKKIILSMIFVFAFASFGFSKGMFFEKILKESPQVTINGTVKALPMWGDFKNKGMTILSNGKMFKIYGVGPAKYWMKKGVSTPKIGENVVVEAYKININGKNYFLAKSFINAKGEKIALRDSKTGAPLWKKMMHNMKNCKMKRKMSFNAQ